MANWRGGASGAVSGAAVGSTFGPVGAGIGAALGGVAGLFGGGGQSDAEKAAARRRKALMKMLQGNYSRVKGQDATSSSYFQSGAGVLRDMLQERAKSGEAALVRRGAGGSEMAIAQQAQRQETLAEGLRGLTSDSERFLADRQARALGRMLQAQGLFEGAAGRSQRQRLAGQANLTRSIAAAAPALGDFAQRRRERRNEEEETDLA